MLSYRQKLTGNKVESAIAGNSSEISSAMAVIIQISKYYWLLNAKYDCHFVRCSIPNRNVINEQLCEKSLQVHRRWFAICNSHKSIRIFKMSTEVISLRKMMWWKVTRTVKVDWLIGKNFGSAVSVCKEASQFTLFDSLAHLCSMLKFQSLFQFFFFLILIWIYSVPISVFLLPHFGLIYGIVLGYFWN